LALDVGAKRIGLAVSDPLGLTAQGLDTLIRGSRREVLEHLAKVIEKNEVKELVVGRPIRLGGESSVQTLKAEKFAQLLKETFGLPVHLHDERLTSWEANQLLNQEKLSRHERKGKVDRIAACLILRSFLDSRDEQS
jgi:putative Holliday junction resolvase